MEAERLAEVELDATTIKEVMAVRNGAGDASTTRVPPSVRKR